MVWKGARSPTPGVAINLAIFGFSIKDILFSEFGNDITFIKIILIHSVMVYKG
jgi:hypothetical protein